MPASHAAGQVEPALQDIGPVQSTSQEHDVWQSMVARHAL
jgi:hypothetical protein